MERKKWIMRGLYIAGLSLIAAGSVVIYNMMNQTEAERQTDMTIERMKIMERRMVPMGNDFKIQIVTPSPTLQPLK